MERSFDNVLEPILSEEYDVDYAFNTVILKMMTDWPNFDVKAFTNDLYHVCNSLILIFVNLFLFLVENNLCSRTYGEAF